MARSVVAQQGQVPRTLLGDQYVTVGQYQQAPRIGETGRERRRGETRRDLQVCPLKGTVSDRSVTIGGGLRGRQVIGVEVEAPADLVLGLEILRQLFLRNRALRRRRRCCAAADDNASTAATLAARTIDEMREFIAMIALYSGCGERQGISKRPPAKSRRPGSLERDGPPRLSSRKIIACVEHSVTGDYRFNTAREQPGMPQGIAVYLSGTNHSVRRLPCHYGNFGSGIGFSTGRRCCPYDRRKGRLAGMAATVTAIYRYPVKGLSAERMDRAALIPGQCLPHDRRFAIALGSTLFDPQRPNGSRRSISSC